MRVVGDVCEREGEKYNTLGLLRQPSTLSDPDPIDKMWASKANSLHKYCTYAHYVAQGEMVWCVIFC